MKLNPTPLHYIASYHTGCVWGIDLNNKDATRSVVLAFVAVEPVCCLLLSSNTEVYRARTPDYRFCQPPCCKADRQKTRNWLIGSY